MLRRSVLAALVAAVLTIGTAPPAHAAEVAYAPPVDGEVVDGFRPPASRYGAGNRGVDYATSPGGDVHAAAEGTVVFAGRIGAASHVVVLHADGIRTSYSFLTGAEVRRGQRVGAGDVVGTAGRTVHFGARAGQEYLDPTALFGGGPPKVHLVPADQRHPLAEWQERRNLVESLGGLGADLVGGVGDLVTPVAAFVTDVGADVAMTALEHAARQFTRIDEAIRAWAHTVNAPFAHDERLAARTERVTYDQRDCTPSSTVTPSSPGAGRIAVLVAGLGSRGGGGAVLDVDTAALGYAEGMVAQLSYTGGQAPGDRTIPGIPVNDYEPRDTWRDLRVAGDHLRALLQDVARVHPGVPVDLIAHSQGGIVVRAALSGADQFDPTLPYVANVVTLGTPHHGAVLATTANALLLSDGEGGPLQEASGALGAPMGRSTQQLASSSHLIDELGRLALPAGANVTSIAAVGDLTVDAQLSAIDDATNVLVPIPVGRHAHDQLPGHAETRREIALALAGLGPQCRDVGPDLATIDAVNLGNHVPWVLASAKAGLGRAPAGPVHFSTALGGNGPPG